jgi:succinate dehydrogenase / fumarate reductase membrane anchor subunit
LGDGFLEINFKEKQMKRSFSKGSFRPPLGRVQNLGSARDGTEDFIRQRLSAIALVPLLLWFAYSMACLSTADYQTVVTWMRFPVNTILLILLILVGFYHAHVGLHEVFEDYLHSPVVKALSMVAMKFALITLTVASVLAILRVAL